MKTHLCYSPPDGYAHKRITDHRVFLLPSWYRRDQSAGHGQPCYPSIRGRQTRVGRGDGSLWEHALPRLPTGGRAWHISRCNTCHKHFRMQRLCPALVMTFSPGTTATGEKKTLGFSNHIIYSFSLEKEQLTGWRRVLLQCHHHHHHHHPSGKGSRRPLL